MSRYIGKAFRYDRLNIDWMVITGLNSNIFCAIFKQFDKIDYSQFYIEKRSLENSVLLKDYPNKWLSLYGE